MLITEQKELDALCARLSGEEFITIDTEFLREKTYYPKLCLVQVCGPDGNAAAIDPLEGDLDLSPLFALLENEKVLKIFHAARQDLEIFFHMTGKVVHPFFDTQIAAMVLGHGEQVGYEALVRNITGAQIDKSVQFTNWAHRPLSAKQIDYALGDVIHLLEIYRKLAADLEGRGRTSWVFEEEAILEDPATYENDPEETWKRIKIRSPKPKTLAILKALSAWRERRAQDRDIPKSWVMRDETLADMAAQAPKDADGLKKIRGMSADLASGHVGKDILKVIKEAAATPKEDWPQAVKKKPLPPTTAAVVDALKMLLKIQCGMSDVAAKLVASADDLEEIAVKGENADVPALKGWRREVFGEAALQFKQGKLAIGLKDSKIVKYDVSHETSTVK